MKAIDPMISIIIPTLNEAERIGPLVDYLIQNSNKRCIAEIIVVDGGSTDGTPNRAGNKGVRLLYAPMGRAKQMNFGAKNATAGILYFLHADSFPPKDFDQYILKAVSDGFETGCFRLKFNKDSTFLNFFAWFTQWNFPLCRGGDQSLFITKRLFEETQGYNENYTIYEDNEFTGRLYKKTAFKILPHYIITSARKYDSVGMITLQYHFTVIHLKKFFGATPDGLHRYYRKHISKLFKPAASTKTRVFRL